MPLSGPDPARDAEDPKPPAAAEPQPEAARGRFGVAEFPVDRNLAAAAERALPSRRRIDPDEPPQPPFRRRPPLVWLAVAAVMAVFIGGAVAVAVSGSGEGDPAVVERPTVPPTSLEIDITLPPPDTVPATTTTEPWTPPEPDPDLIVYDSPGTITPSKELIEFRGESKVETLVLANDGGGAANWVLSVQAGSGLDVSPPAGQLRPGESVEVRILLDRANGRPLTDWAEDITMLGGGSTRPTSLRVKIFSI